MDNESEKNKTISRPEILLLFMLLFSFAYFYHPVLFDNALTRLDLSYSIVFNHGISIDTWHANTIDKALQGGHYYCDKAPGLSILSAPVLAVLDTALRTLSADPSNPLLAYLLTLIMVSVPSALSFMLLFRIIRAYTGSDASAAAVTLATALGSMCFTYSTQFYGNQFAASLGIVALYLIFVPMREARPPSSRELLLCGLVSGFAVLSDYPAALPCAVVAAIALFSTKPRARIAWLAAGAIPAILILAGYNTAAFGSPFSLGYFKEVDPLFHSGNTRGLGGVTVPDLAVMGRLLFSPQRSLLWLSPYMLFAVPGCVSAFKSSGWKRSVALGAALIFILVLLMNSAYYEPYGGFAPGPRFMTTGIPFLSIAIAAGWSRMRPFWRSVFAALAALSISVNFVLNAVEPHVPHVFNAPLFQFVIPMVKGGFTFNNIASLLNLYGYYSFIPLVVILGACAAGFIAKHSSGGARKTLFSAAPAFVFFIAVFCAVGSSFPKPAQSDFFTAQMWYRYALIQVRSGDFEEAELIFHRSIDTAPDYLQAYVSLAACLLLDNKPGEAAPLLLRAGELSYNQGGARSGDIERLLRDARAAKNGTKSQ